MKTSHLLFVLLLFGLLLPTACASKDAGVPVVPSGAKAGDLVDLHTCTYAAGKADYPADCGTLVVSENRSNPAARLKRAIPVVWHCCH